MALFAIVIGNETVLERLGACVYQEGQILDFLEPLQDFFQTFFVLLLHHVELDFEQRDFFLKPVKLGVGLRCTLLARDQFRLAPLLALLRGVACKVT